MGRYLESKCKLCRRLDLKLFLKGTRCDTAKCPMEKEKGHRPPGQHGKKRHRLTDYGIHKREAQRAKRTYGTLARQFKRYFREALKQPGNTGAHLIQELERRLDNVSYRLRFALSRSHARQLITHGHIRVNDKKVTSPSYPVSGGDVITCAQNDRSRKLITETVKVPNRADIPSWLKLDDGALQGTVVRLPVNEELQVPLDPNLIVEYMSR